MQELRVSLETVTPLFLGGAEPDTYAELRPPSIKGALRFWYRALDPDYRSGEPAAFGSTETGQAPVLLRAAHHVRGSVLWPRPANQAAPAGRDYLGYTMNLGNNTRRAVGAGNTLELIATAHRHRSNPRIQRAWVAAFWCLAQFGGLGMRARRGFGSLRLTQLSGWPESDGPAEQAPQGGAGPGAGTLRPVASETPEEWLAAVRSGLGTLRTWYPTRPAADHPVLDGQSRILLVRGLNPQDGATHGFATWEEALDAAGEIMRGFRQRQPAAEYMTITDYLHDGPKPGHAPSRAAFGLPMTIRSTGTEKWLEVNAVESDRQPSPLLIRVVRIGERFHPLFSLLNAPSLEAKSVRLLRAARVEGRRAVDERLGTLPFASSPRTVLNNFLDAAVTPRAYPEIRPRENRP